MKRVFIVIFPILICSVLIACSNNNNVQNNQSAESTSNFEQTLNSADTAGSEVSKQNSNVYQKDDSNNSFCGEVKDIENSVIGSTDKGNAETDNSSSKDIIKNETTTIKDKTNNSGSGNEISKTDTDNNEIDIDNIIGDNYF